MAPRVHHLDCCTMCPAMAPLINGVGSWWSAGRLVCHCMVVEAGDRLVLVETGLGTEDVANPGRLPAIFRLSARPRLDPKDTAIEQLRALGHKPEDVRDILVTHLDVDHAGGLGDFPDARVHVSIDEREASQSGHHRYVPAQWAHGPKWQTHAIEGERWFGFDAVRAVPDTDCEVLLIPLPGHSVGHCGVAVRTEDRWILHCGDAFFHRNDLQGRPPPFGLRLFQRVVDTDRHTREANRKRLQALATDHADEVTVINAHDPELLARFAQ